MKHVVYVMRFADGSEYVGATSDLSRRRRTHLKQMRRGRHDNKAVQAVFAAHGEPTFEVAAVGEAHETLHELEHKVREARHPVLNAHSRKLPLPAKQHRSGARPWGPYASLKEAAVAMGLGYNTVKRAAALFTHAQYVLIRATAAEAERQSPLRRAEAAAARAARAQKFRDSQKIVVDGVLAFPIEHRKRLGVSEDRYRKLRKRGLDPFAPENRITMPTPPRYITALGRTQTVTEWAKETGLSKQLITQRIDRYGWTPDNAVSQPPYEPGHFLKQAAAALAEDREQK